MSVILTSKPFYSSTWRPIRNIGAYNHFHIFLKTTYIIITSSHHSKNNIRNFQHNLLVFQLLNFILL